MPLAPSSCASGATPTPRQSHRRHIVHSARTVSYGAHHSTPTPRSRTGAQPRAPRGLAPRTANQKHITRKTNSGIFLIDHRTHRQQEQRPQGQLPARNPARHAAARRASKIKSELLEKQRAGFFCSIAVRIAETRDEQRRNKQLRRRASARSNHNAASRARMRVRREMRNTRHHWPCGARDATPASSHSTAVLRLQSSRQQTALARRLQAARETR